MGKVISSPTCTPVAFRPVFWSRSILIRPQCAGSCWFVSVCFNLICNRGFAQLTCNLTEFFLIRHLISWEVKYCVHFSLRLVMFVKRFFLNILFTKQGGKIWKAGAGSAYFFLALALQHCLRSLMRLCRVSYIFAQKCGILSSRK